MKKFHTTTILLSNKSIRRIVNLALIVGVLIFGFGSVNKVDAANNNSLNGQRTATVKSGDSQSGDDSADASSDQPPKDVTGKIVPVDPTQQSLDVTPIPYGPVQEDTTIDVPVVAGYYPEDSQDVDSLVVGVQVQVPKNGGVIYVTYLKSGSTGGSGSGSTGGSSSSSSQSVSSSSSSNTSSSTNSGNTSASSSGASSDTPKIPDAPSQNDSKSTSKSQSTSVSKQAAGQNSQSEPNQSWLGWLENLFGRNSASQNSASSSKESKNSSSSQSTSSKLSNDAGSKSSKTEMKSAAGRNTHSSTQWVAISITVASAGLLGGVIVLIWKQRHKA
ncbi:MAG: hypothetical protein LKI92_02320 [Schleiferilactobacillus harbinensis]|jgi:hypothetical protein|nr:hypothetical protein [Schleiferilactobacillus harbinensis]MCI1911560.1 hypothetical protein [Schleiferilactobacillus harbinensis]